MSTARHADQIIVLDQGRIIEHGSHAELLAQGGYYAELERVQREGAEEEDLQHGSARHEPSGEKSACSEGDYAIFEADIMKVLNMQLLRRLPAGWQSYKLQLLLSTVLVLLVPTLQILLPIIISLVVIDHVLRDESSTDTPDFGMIEFNQSLAGTLDIPPLLAACILYGVLQIGSAVFGHAHRMTLIQANKWLKGLTPRPIQPFRNTPVVVF